MGRGARSRPIYPPFYLLFAIILMIAVDRVAPVARIVPEPLRYWGIAPMAIGVAIGLWVNLIFHRAGTTIKPFEESSKLIVGGPFSMTRNPIYLGMTVFLTGLAVLLGSLTPFLVVPVFAVLVDRHFIRAEEAMLTDTFGERYQAYASRVRRWI